jgi:recombination protein RecT
MAPTSSTAALKIATGLEQQKKPQTFQSMLAAMRGQIEDALPRSMSVDRMTRIALTEYRKNPDLGLCDMQSVCGSIIVSAQLGLEPGIMGQAYLVPFKSKDKRICTFIPGWQGYVDLVSRSGRASAWTGAAYEGDEFDASLGSDPFVHHKPDWNVSPEGRRLLYVYSVGEQKGASRPVVDVWGFQKVLHHRSLYNKVGDKHYSYRDSNNMEMYARKLPLLQVVKYLPKSVELQRAASLDYAADSGTQALTIEGAKVDLAFDAPEETTQTAEMPVTPYDQAFEILRWDGAQRKAFLDEHKGRSEEDIKSLLNVEVDRLP